MEKYDVLIIGAGAAGLTAAIYTGRKELKTGVISIDIGGQCILTNHIENYPGIEEVPGSELISHFQKQASKFGAELIMGEVEKIEKRKHGFCVDLKDGKKYSSRAVIVASGKTARRLGIPGEDKFFGRGVATCATCDAPLFRGKSVVVIGGGNSAFEATELLHKLAKKVYLVHRSENFNADEVTIEAVKKMKNVEIVTHSVAKEVKGDKFVEGIIIENIKNGEQKELKAEGMFVEIGYELKTDWLKGLVKRNQIGEIIIDGHGRTSEKGIFAAGDVTTVPYKQVVISAGEGAKAALESYKYVKGAVVAFDWHKEKGKKVEGKNGSK